MNTSTVLVTDHAWPDLSIERQIIESAGFRMAAGPADPSEAARVADMVREHRPASILTCWAEVDAGAIAAFDGLRHVGRIGVGLDNIDVTACAARGVLVTNVPDYCMEEVSDHALAFALAWTRGLVTFDRAVRAGRWEPAAARLRRLCTLQVGIVGLGRIGAVTARKFQALGCTVKAHDPGARREGGGVELLPLDQLLAGSDIVVLHVPLTSATRHLIDRDRLTQMKAGALLINVSRGGLVDSDALAEALASGRIGAAALDVIESEPHVPAALRDHPGTLLTPHVAFSSDAALAELRARAAQEAVRVLRGEAPLNPCTPIPA